MLMVLVRPIVGVQAIPAARVHLAFPRTHDLFGGYSFRAVPASGAAHCMYARIRATSHRWYSALYGSGGRATKHLHVRCTHLLLRSHSLGELSSHSHNVQTAHSHLSFALAQQACLLVRLSAVGRLHCQRPSVHRGRLGYRRWTFSPPLPLFMSYLLMPARTHARPTVAHSTRIPTRTYTIQLVSRIRCGVATCEPEAARPVQSVSNRNAIKRFGQHAT